MNYASVIKSAVPCRMLMDSVGIAVNRQGYAICPFHSEKTASLKVYNDPERGFHCFGCGANGNVIDFTMQYFGINYNQAIHKLDDMFHLGLPFGKPKWKKGSIVKAGIRANDRKRAEDALNAAETAFWAAFDDWLENDRIIAEEAPEGPLEPFTDRFASALKRRDEVRYRLDVAEYELDKARHAK